MPAVRKLDVPITVVYEIDCRVCGEAVWPDERVTSLQEACALRDAHIAEHKRGEL